MRRWTMVAILTAALIGAGLIAFAIVSAQNGPDETATSEPPVTPSSGSVTPSAPTLPPDDESLTRCGEWKNPERAGSIGATLTEQYGALRLCGLFRDTWIITTSGYLKVDPPVSGVFAFYACEPQDDVCLDATTDHPISGWTIITPPYVGSVGIIRSDNNQVDVAVGNKIETHLLIFDLKTETLRLFR